MPVDLAFELSYMLSDKTGKEVEVTTITYDDDRGLLCIEARVEGVIRRACTQLRQCRKLDETRRQKCISKALASSEKYVEDLANKLIQAS